MPARRRRYTMRCFGVVGARHVVPICHPEPAAAGEGSLRCVISSVARNLSERFLGPTNPVGPRNDKGGQVIPTNIGGPQNDKSGDVIPGNTVGPRNDKL